MSNYPPKEEKRTEECKKLAKNWSRCKEIKETHSDFYGETYDCPVCGASYYLDYDEMR